MGTSDRLDPVADEHVGTPEQIRIHDSFVTKSAQSLIPMLTGPARSAYSAPDDSRHADMGLDLAPRA